MLCVSINKSSKFKEKKDSKFFLTQRQSNTLKYTAENILMDNKSVYLEAMK